MTGIIILSVVTAIIIVLCAIILSGKGDHLIAGYNTASEKERRQYDIKRLRLVIASMCLLTILVCWIPIMSDSIIIGLSIPMLCFIIIYAGILLINNWCKKKYDKPFQ